MRAQFGASPGIRWATSWRRAVGTTVLASGHGRDLVTPGAISLEAISRVMLQVIDPLIRKSRSQSNRSSASNKVSCSFPRKIETLPFKLRHPAFVSESMCRPVRRELCSSHVVSDTVSSEAKLTCSWARHEARQLIECGRWDSRHS